VLSTSQSAPAPSAPPSKAGDNTGVNGANLFFPEEFGIADNQWLVGFINAAPTISGLFAAWAADPLNNITGRRGLILFTSLFCVFPVLAQAFTPSWWGLLVCRRTANQDCDHSNYDFKGGAGYDSGWACDEFPALVGIWYFNWLLLESYFSQHLGDWRGDFISLLLLLMPY
jgi:MFS family permease